MTKVAGQARRAEAARYALGTLALEGLKPSPAAVEDMNRYVRGEMTLVEMRERTFRRFGHAVPKG